MSPLSILFAFSVFSGADYFDANNTFVQINNGDDFLDSISFVQGRVKRARDWDVWNNLNLEHLFIFCSFLVC